MDIILLETELSIFQNKVTMLCWDDASNRKKDCNNSKFIVIYTAYTVCSTGIMGLLHGQRKHPGI